MNNEWLILNIVAPQIHRWPNLLWFSIVWSIATGYLLGLNQIKHWYVVIILINYFYHQMIVTFHCWKNMNILEKILFYFYYSTSWSRLFGLEVVSKWMLWKLQPFKLLFLVSYTVNLSKFGIIIIIVVVVWIDISIFELMTFVIRWFCFIIRLKH